MLRKSANRRRVNLNTNVIKEQKTNNQVATLDQRSEERRVDVPVDARGTADVYIDDTIALTVDVEDSNNVQRLEQATLLAIQCAAREKHKDEPIPREEMAAQAKLLAKAGAEEIKIILGWILDSELSQ